MIPRNTVYASLQRSKNLCIHTTRCASHIAMLIVVICSLPVVASPHSPTNPTTGVRESPDIRTRCPGGHHTSKTLWR